jgi:hypothetical protein
MLPVIVIAGLIVLFLAVKSSSSGSGAASVGGVGAGNTGMPDPGATNASMGGSSAHGLPPNNAIVPYAGTSKQSPGTSPARMNMTNRTTLWQTGQVEQTLRVPNTQSVRTTNPATVPFSAFGTRAFATSQGAAGGVPTVATAKGVKV